MTEPDLQIPATSWAVWAWQAYRDGRLVEAPALPEGARVVTAGQILKWEACLEELHAMVRGECPSLLNEDSGGNACLDLDIEEAIAAMRRIAGGE